MAPIQYTASMENNNSAAAIDSAKCESSMSKKTSSSSAQSSQCYQTSTKTSEQMSKSETSSNVSDFKSGSEMKLSSLRNNISSIHSSINDGNVTNSNTNSPMAIQTRGNFFEDSFFADVRENFQRAVSEVLEKWGESSSLCDKMTSYRKLRQLDLKEENQAGTISYGEKENKIVLDVHDFKQGDIKVKVVENNTIQITGHVEKKNGNTVSTQSFHRQFTIPGTVDMTMVTSSMSSDGILTILVPKLENKQISNTQLATGIDSELSRNKEINQCNSKNNKATEDCMKTTTSKDSNTSLISQASNRKSTVEAESKTSVSNTTDVFSKDKYTIGASIKHPIQMTITKRGNFFEDTFFADVNDNFQKAVSEVLEKWGEKSSLCDDMISYRNLRQRDLKEENQAAAISYGEKEHKVVLDVNDFKQSDIEVQIIGDNTIQITGHMEKKNGNAISTQSFHRQFTLPGTVDMALVTSSMSSDGILTVIIPKLSTKQMLSNTQKDNEICNESNLNKETYQCSDENTINSGRSTKIRKTRESMSSITSQESDIKSEIEAKLSDPNSNTADVCSEDKEPNLNKQNNECTIENAKTTGKSMKTSKTEDSKSYLISQESNTKSGIEANLSSSKSNTADICLEDNNICGASNVQPVLMTIRKRGNFFEDSFFSDVHENFQRAIREILEKGGESTSLGNDMTSYRNLRQRDLKEENQAATVSYGEKEHKIVLDVNDFKKDDITVQIIEESTVQISGHMEKKIGNAISTQSFHRQFTLPGTVDVTLVTSSMSSDGILTVIIPRLATKQIISSTNKDKNICKETNFNKEANQCSHENTITTGKSMKSMKAEETKSSKISQAYNIESGIGVNLSSSNCITADVYSEDKKTNFDKETNECSNENAATTSKSMKTMKTEDSKSSLISQESNTKSGIVTNVSSLNSNTTDVCSENKDTQGASNGQPESMTIRKRGNFFEDSFFADVHTHFQKAVSEVLEKFGETSSVGDDMTTYRSLRQRNLKEENQAAAVSYGEKEHKIVLDVNDFKKGDIKVKILDYNTVQITGTIENKNGNVISTQSFHRQFTLPGLPGTIDMPLVTSSMSSDGILIVIIPRIATKHMISNTNKDDIYKESSLNKEANQCSHENTITSGKSMKTMKAEETIASIMSQAFNIESGIGANLSYPNSKTADVLPWDKDSNLNKERDECSNENAASTSKSMKTMKTEDSKPSLISQESNTKSGIVTNLSSLNSNTTDVCSEDKYTEGSSNGQPESMTIRKRGNFFEDSFFADVRTNFQKAVSEVLEKFGETSSVGDDMTTYRNLRQRDLKEENQAATVSYGEKEHKIVLDVNDFKKGDIKVKILDYNTVQITGTIGNKNGNVISTQSFHRQFTLPGLPGTVGMTLVTSSMSSDGILTVIIPRIASKQMISNTKKDDICKESILNKEANHCSHENTISPGKTMKTMKTEDSKSSKLSQASNTESEIGENLLFSNSNTADVFSEDKESNMDRETNEYSNENATLTGKSMKTIKAQESKSSLISQESNTKSGIETNFSSSNSNTPDICTEDKDTQGTSNGQSNSMTIIKRGNFFEDTFFADVHKKFQKAVSEVLEKCGESSSVGDDMTSYRNLRQHDLKEENQAATVSYGEKEHKIVLDVNDFKEGDIKVKIIEDNTVQITGHIEKKTGSAISTQSFHRQFILPGTVDMTLVTSSMSSDGILTVIIPRIATKQMISNPKKDHQICKESNLNNKTKQGTNENTITTGKSMTTMKAEESKSCIVSQVSNKIGESMEVMNNSKSSLISQKANATTGTEAHIVYSNKAVDVRYGATNKEVNHEMSKNIIENDEARKNEKIRSPLDSEECDTKLNTKVQSSYSNKMASLNNIKKDNQNISMIIQRKGKFFEDSFFGNVQENFKKAVSEIVKKCEESSSLRDSMEAYRNLRQHNLQEENRAMTVLYGEKEHEIILDVHDFTKEDIKIKTVENTIQVTGHIENKNGNAVSTQSFHRQFTLPGTVDMASVTSSMSSDSILTITVPTINAQFTKNTHELLKNRIDPGEMSTANSEKQCPDNFHNTSNYAKQAVKKHIQQTSSYNSSQSSSSTLESILTPSHVTNIHKNTEMSDLFSPINLLISRRGQFFQDSFFNDSQKQFDEAMKSILNEFGNTNQVIDTEQRYRNLRQKELKEEQQACSMIQDSQKHKIVIDVKEFMEGNINVKVIGETKILVEGENKQQKGISMSSQRFNRSFVLPNKIDASSVQSSMSSDGILSITVPQIMENRGYTKY